MNRRQQLSQAKRELERLADAAASTDSPVEVDRLSRQAEQVMTKIDQLEQAIEIKARHKESQNGA